MDFDSRGQPYLEVEMSNTEQVRITYVQNGWSGTPALRVSIRQPNGHLRQGPEIPVEQIPSTIEAMIRLLVNGSANS